MERIHENIAGKTLKAENQHLDEFDLLRSRLNLLEGKDKVLMTMYIENGNSFRQIARLLNISDTRVARRIHRLTKGLTGGDYINCLRHRDKFTGHQMNIARDFFLLGLSIRRIAAKRRRSRYFIHETIVRIQRYMKNSA